MRAPLLPFTLVLAAAACADAGSPNAEADAGGDGTSEAASDEGDSGGTTGDAGSSDDESTGPVIPVIDCTDACVDTTTDAGIAVCYSCRCKSAMDGWLPSIEELQCANADPIVIYSLDAESAELVPVEGTVTECANPSLLTWSCETTSRLGQIQHGDILFKWICRDVYEYTGEPRYNDMGAIAYNARTGASCWWDDNNDVTTDENLPDLSLFESDEANLEQYLATFYNTEGDSCTDCHDNDPFIYTPYLQSTGWITGPHALGAFTHTRVGGGFGASKAVHLVSPEVAPCTLCHRISSNGTCDFLAADSMGVRKDADSYEQAVLDAMATDSEAWRVAYWMPNPAPLVHDLQEWLRMYGAARDRVTQCCAEPGVDSPDCTWEPVPTEVPPK